jgi:hypothetical protein
MTHITNRLCCMALTALSSLRGRDPALLAAFPRGIVPEGVSGWKLPPIAMLPSQMPATF